MTTSGQSSPSVHSTQRPALQRGVAPVHDTYSQEPSASQMPAATGACWHVVEAGSHSTHSTPPRQKGVAPVQEPPAQPTHWASSSTSEHTGEGSTHAVVVKAPVGEQLRTSSLTVHVAGVAPGSHATHDAWPATTRQRTSHVVVVHVPELVAQDRRVVVSVQVAAELALHAAHSPVAGLQAGVSPAQSVVV